MRTEALSVLGAALLLVPAAAADEPGLELSRDGRTWTSSLVGPLLDEDIRIVPGGSTGADVWVRNSSDVTTSMSLTTRGTSSSLPSGVAPRDDFRVRVAGASLSGTGASGCRVLTSAELDPGERARIPITVALPSTSRNVSEDQSLTLALRVRLVEGDARHACDPAPGGPSPSPPPETPGVVQTDGGPWEAGLSGDLLGAALIVVAGALALRRRGRARSSRPTS